MNIPKYADEFVQEMKRRNYSGQTIENYRSCLCKFLSEIKKEHPIHINETDIKNYLGKFDEPNTQRSVHSAIKKFYDICMGQKEKFKFIPYCRKSKKLPIVLSVDEVQKMFNVCGNKKHRAILALMYSCGIRVSEIINLEMVHIDRSRMILNIIQSKGKKDRQCPLDPTALRLVEDYYRNEKEKPLRWLFNGQSGQQYSQRSVLEVMKQLATKAGLTKRVYSHLMRHNCFTHMVEQGLDINLVQKIAGHSSVRTTNLYLHLSDRFISNIHTPMQSITI